jgi:hypothetical protein
MPQPLDPRPPAEASHQNCPVVHSISPWATTLHFFVSQSVCQASRVVWLGATRLTLPVWYSSPPSKSPEPIASASPVHRCTSIARFAIHPRSSMLLTSCQRQPGLCLCLCLCDPRPWHCGRYWWVRGGGALAAVVADPGLAGPTWPSHRAKQGSKLEPSQGHWPEPSRYRTDL